MGDGRIPPDQEASGDGPDLDPFLRELAQAPAREDPGSPRRPAVPEQLGHYRILKSIGRGGMGEVFEAHDSTLDRLVALKVLPGEMADDPTQVRRFIQEAKSASALNHPNIVTIYEIYDVEYGEGRTAHCVAMELIRGETLRAWLGDRPELSRVVEVFVQIATGLSKAHAAGIVHRDLKPDNVMITDDGLVKILDFGLVKLVEPPKRLGAGGKDRTGAPVLTRTGMMMGTIGYMSPEQVQGENVDRRSDVFAFGSMLFEAASGQRPFEVDNTIDTLHNIVRGEPPLLSELNPRVPPELQRIVRKCMTKDPEERYQTTQDLVIDLRQLGLRYVRGSVPGSSDEALLGGTTTPVALGPPRSRRAIAVGLSLVGVVAVAAASVFLTGGPPGTDGPGQAASEGRGAALQIERLTYSGRASAAVIAPDGKVVVHAVEEGGRSSLWVRQVVTASSLRIVNAAPVEYTGVTISPDGNYVYYIIRRGHRLVSTLYRVPILGGAPRRIGTGIDSPVTFSPRGRRIAFIRRRRIAETTELVTTRVDGKDARVIAKQPINGTMGAPAWSPDGKRIAFFGRVEGSRGFSIFVVSPVGGAPRRLTRRIFVQFTGLVWLPKGVGLLAAAIEEKNWINQLWRVSFPGGATRRVTNDPTHYLGVSISQDGKTIVTTRGDRTANIWERPQGGQPRKLTTGVGLYNDVACAAGGQIVYTVLRRGRWDLWLLPGPGESSRRLTSDAGSNLHPHVSPDGKTIVFVSDRQGMPGIWRMDIGGGDQRRLTRGDLDSFPEVTPDGRDVVFSSGRGGKYRIWKVSITGGAPKLVTSDFTRYPAVSPDGTRLAGAYWDGKPDSPLKVAIFPFAGGRPSRTFRLPPTSSLRVRWTPDGSGFSYVDTRDGAANVWIQPLGGPPRKATSFSGDTIFDHRWSRKDGKLVMVRGLTTSDVVVVRGVR